MPFPTAIARENAAIGSVSNATHVALFGSVGGANPGDELSGGAYVRVPVSWQHGAVDGEVSSGELLFSVPAGSTIRGFGLFSAATGGTYINGGSLPEEFYAGAGDYTLTVISRVN